jgi:hypothetical protein
MYETPNPEENLARYYKKSTVAKPLKKYRKKARAV